jgi:hypothetical protein
MNWEDRSTRNAFRADGCYGASNLQHWHADGCGASCFSTVGWRKRHGVCHCRLRSTPASEHLRVRPRINK